MKHVITILLSSVMFFAGPMGLAQDKKQIRIDLWEQDSPEVGDEMDKWIAVFQRSHPNIRIVRQHYENEEMRTKYLRSSVTGDGADIVYGPNDIAGVFVTAGVIQAVDDLIPAGKFDQTAVDVTKLDGKIWGVPLSVGNHLLLYYNKKLAAKAPETFEDLIKVGKESMKGKSNHYGLAMYQSEPFWFLPFLGAFGGWPLKKEGDRVEVTLDTPESRSALEYLISLKDEHKIMPQDCDYECAKTMFLSGRAPFHINGDWEITTYKEKFGDQLGIAPLPKIASQDRYVTPIVGGRYLFINANAKDERLEAINTFVKFLSEPAIQVRLATRLNRIPSTLEARNHPQVKSLETLDELTKTVEHAKPSPSEVEMRAAWDGLRIMVQRGMAGREKVAEATKTGQKAANEALQALRTEDKKNKTVTKPATN
ncbi:MAG: extracellular solute-binding protein [Oligoflexus sp.]